MFHKILKINELKIFIILAVILMPDLFSQYRIASWIFAIINIYIFVSLIIKKPSRSKLLIAWMLFNAYKLMLMIFNGNLADLDRLAKLAIFTANGIMLIQLCVKKKITRELLSASSKLGVLFLLINIITIIVYPDGIVSNLTGNYYFLGTRVNFLRYIFPFLAASGLYFIYYKNWKYLLNILFMSIFMIVKFQVSTAIASFIVIVIMLLLKKPLSMVLNTKRIIICTLILNIGFIFLNAAEFYKWFIVSVLHKDVTLTSRMYIWKLALGQIVENPFKMIIGHGIINDGAFVFFSGLYWPAHSQLLQFVYE